MRTIIRTRVVGISVWCGYTAIVVALSAKNGGQADRTTLAVAMLTSIVASVLTLKTAFYAAERIEAKSKAGAFLKHMIASDAGITPSEAVALVVLFAVTFASLIWAIFQSSSDR